MLGPVDLGVVECTWNPVTCPWEPGWTDINNILTPNGGTIEIVDHPLLGKAFKFTVTEYRLDDNPVRSYPAKEWPRIDGAVDWSMKWSVVFGPGSLPKRGTWSTTNLGSLFSKIWRFDETWSVIAGFDVQPDGPVITAKDGSGQRWKEYYAIGHQFVENKRYDIEMYTSGDKIMVRVNGELWVSGAMHPDLVGVAPVMAHAGLYGARIEKGAVLYNGPLEVTLYERRK